MPRQNILKASKVTFMPQQNIQNLADIFMPWQNIQKNLAGYFHALAKHFHASSQWRGLVFAHLSLAFVNFSTWNSFNSKLWFFIGKHQNIDFFHQQSNVRHHHQQNYKPSYPSQFWVSSPLPPPPCVPPKAGQPLVRLPFKETFFLK